MIRNKFENKKRGRIKSGLHNGEMKNSHFTIHIYVHFKDESPITEENN
jgi:hypothetical protein